jgi:glycosyltransferase involved in cell wall biosynthesis
MGVSRPRRICFVVPTLSRHGAETQLFHIASGLRSRGFDVHVVAMLSSDYFGAVLESRGITVTCLEVSRKTNPVRILARFLSHVRALQPSALVGFNYPGVLLARLAGALARTPVVISSVHTVNQGTRLRKRSLTWTDSLGTMTAAVSQAVARSLIDSGVAPSRVRVIPNGIDIGTIGPHLRSDRQALRASLGVRDHEFLWFAAGRLDPAKDYPNLLAAMALLATTPADVRLMIAGEGPLAGMLRTRASAYGLDRVVSFLGVRQDVPSCMAAADATVLSSAWEGLPLVVLESLAVGTPVVSTDVGSVRDIIQHGDTGFVVAPRDPKALASAMAALMTRSQSERFRMGAAGRVHVERNFAVEPVVARWADLLDELLDGAPHAEPGVVPGLIHQSVARARKQL